MTLPSDPQKAKRPQLQIVGTSGSLAKVEKDLQAIADIESCLRRVEPASQTLVLIIATILKLVRTHRTQLVQEAELSERRYAVAPAEARPTGDWMTDLGRFNSDGGVYELD